MTTDAHRPDARTRPACALAALMLLANAAAAQTFMSISPPLGQFQCEETFVIDVMVDADAIDLHGASFVLEFDDDVVRPLGVTAGALVAGAPCSNFTYWFGPANADSVAVDVANLGCAVDGPGSIARITFEGYIGGTTTVTLRSCLLRTTANAPIPFTFQGAVIHYECAVGDERSTWGTLKSLYR